jgi:transposase-like protein
LLPAKRPPLPSPSAPRKPLRPSLHLNQPRSAITFATGKPTIDPLTQETLTHAAAHRLRRQHLSTEAHAIFEAPTRAEAEARLAQFCTTWSALQPEVVRRLRKDVDACLSFYQCDHQLHSLIRSTNLLERFFREFRTKSDEIGAFSNDISCLVVFYLIVIRDDAKYDRGHTAKTGWHYRYLKPQPVRMGCED